MSLSLFQTPKHMLWWVGPLLGAVLGVLDVLETAEVEPEVEPPFPPKGAVKKIRGVCVIPRLTTVLSSCCPTTPTLTFAFSCDCGHSRNFIHFLYSIVPISSNWITYTTEIIIHEWCLSADFESSL